MKLKQNLFIVALHILVLIGFSLLQGCAGGPCFVDCLNWPYNVPTEETSIVPGDEQIDFEPLPPEIFPVGPDLPVMPVDITPTQPVVTGPSQSYTVRKGDTLSGIASMYGTTWKKLQAYNGLDNPHKLVVGQEIRIEGSLSPSASSPRSSASASSGSSSNGSSKGPILQGSSYVIQKGDTLSGIATRCGLSIAEIKAANALSSNGIVAGKSLSIPKSGEVSAPVAEPAPQVESAPAVDAAVEPAPLADIAPLAPAASAPVYEHVLYPGETLEDVASQFGSTQEEIMLLNNLASPDDIKPGTKLLIPIPE